MRTFYLSPVLALVDLQTFAQNETSAFKEKLEVAVTDKKTHAPVFATVVARKLDDSTVVAGGQTDSAGHYLLEANSFKNTFLKVDAVGYKSRFYKLLADG